MRLKPASLEFHFIKNPRFQGGILALVRRLAGPGFKNPVFRRCVGLVRDGKRYGCDRFQFYNARFNDDWFPARELDNVIGLLKLKITAPADSGFPVVSDGICRDCHGKYVKMGRPE